MREHFAQDRLFSQNDGEVTAHPPLGELLIQSVPFRFYIVTEWFEKGSKECFASTARENG